MKRTKKLIKCMVFITCYMHCMMQIYFNFYVPVMAKHTALRYFDWNITECMALKHRDQFHDGPQFDWTEMEQWALLSAHGIGHFIVELSSVFLVDMMGPRCTVFLCSAITSAGVLLVPLFASLHWAAVFMLRVCVGMVGGLMMDALLLLMLRWVPNSDKFNFSCLVQAGTLTSVTTTWIVCSLLILAVKWPISLYILGAFVFVWSIMWIIFVTNAPVEETASPSKTIQEDNLELFGGYNAPISMIFNSCPYLALILLHYGDICGVTMFLTIMPKFVYEIVEVHITLAAFFCALPVIIRHVTGYILVCLVNHLVKTDCMDITSIRRFFTIFSHIFTGCTVLTLGYTGCVTKWTVPVICIAACLSGACSVTNHANARDLSPNYFRILFFIMHIIGLTASFLIPIFAGIILTKKNNMEGWKDIFITVAFIYIITGAVFLIFGTGEVQEWNYTSMPSMPKETRSASMIARMIRKGSKGQSERTPQKIMNM